MVVVNSAESVTKRLRSKDISLDELVSISNNLLDGELDIYLPNKSSFILNLICDRLNAQNFANFRKDVRIWKLFVKSWNSLSSESKLRNRIIQGLKVSDVITDALSKIISDEFEEINDSLFASIKILQRSSAFNNLQSGLIDFLTSYLALLLKFDPNQFNYEETFKGLITLFTQSLGSDRISKKFLKGFVTNALPTILKVVEKFDTKDLWLPLIKSIVFQKEHLSDIVENSKLLQKRDLSVGSLVLFYELICDNTPKSEIKTLEDIFIIFIGINSKASHNLLNSILKNKRNVSLEFLTSIFEQEFIKEDTNWKLIIEILKMDIDIGLNNSSRIFKSFEERSDASLSSEVGEQVLESYIKARSLNAFFEVWGNHIDEYPNSQFSSETFIKIVTTKISLLSSTQLLELIEHSLARNVKSKYILLESIVQGHFKIKDQQILQKSKEALKVLFEIEKDENELLWRLRYQLLCLYEDIISEERAREIASAILNSSSPLYQFYTLFRLRELVEFDFSNIATIFTKFIKNRDAEVINFVFRRWLVLVNELFDSNSQEKLVKKLLSHEELLSKVLQNDLIYEQTNIVDCLIEMISSKLSKSKEVDEHSLKALSLIPIQSYHKRFKVPLINSLSEKLFITNTNNEQIINVITQLLQTPTFRSNIETDLTKLTKLEEISPSSNVFEIVWSNHVKNVKDKTSENFINDTINNVVSSFDSKTNDKKVPIAYYLSRTILLNSSHVDGSAISKLQESFISSLYKFLKKSLKRESPDMEKISWIIQTINELDVDFEQISILLPLFKEIGQRAQEAKRNCTIEQDLFLFLAKYAKSTHTSIEYIEALYFVLRENGLDKGQLLKGIESVLKSTDDESFNKAFKLTQDTYTNDGSLFALEIIPTFWKSFKRSSSESQTLLVTSLSSIKNSLNKIIDQDLIISILDSLKALLVEKTWIITQYALEIIISIISQLIDILPKSQYVGKDEIFILSTHTISNILLHHRYRLSNRHHLILSVFTSFLKSLTKKPYENSLSRSKGSARALARLLSNLCEPQGQKENNNDSLNSTIALLKRSLRKYLPNLLLSYIHLSLRYSYQSDVREVLLPGIFNIFDVLSQTELNLVNTSLDSSGRVYYRALYDDYKKIGKWQID